MFEGNQFCSIKKTTTGDKYWNIAQIKTTEHNYYKDA